MADVTNVGTAVPVGGSTAYDTVPEEKPVNSASSLKAIADRSTFQKDGTTASAQLSADGVKAEESAKASRTLAGTHGSTTVAGPGGTQTTVAGHVEAGHLEASESASLKVSASEMRIDANVKIHVDATALQAGGSVKTDIPVNVTGIDGQTHQYHVKLGLSAQGAAGIQGDLQLQLHAGLDGVTANIAGSLSAANASLSVSGEIDDDQGRDVLDVNAKAGASLGVGFAAGGTFSLTRFSAKGQLGPVAAQVSGSFHPMTIARDVAALVKP